MSADLLPLSTRERTALMQAQIDERIMLKLRREDTGAVMQILGVIDAIDDGTYNRRLELYTEYQGQSGRVTAHIYAHINEPYAGTAEISLD